MSRVLYYGWMILLACFVLVCTGSSSDCDMEEGEANIASSDCTIPSYLCPSPYSYSYTSLISNLDPQYNVYHGSSASAHNELPSMQSDCKPLDLSCNTGARESSSHLGAAISTNSDTPTHACSSSDAKRIHEEAEKEDGEQKAEKRQKTNTTATSTAAEANTSLMDETEVRIAIEDFNRCFRDDTKVWIRLPPDIAEFAKDLAQRGLTSAHSSEIVELCTASEQWRGHSVFWRMLMFFVDTLSLEITDLNRLEDKKTIVLKNRKTSDKPLSEYTDRSIYMTIDRCRGAERMKMQRSLNVLESRGTADVLAVLRWLLYHVNIQCVGITCDLREAGMSSAVFERQIVAFAKVWKSRIIHIDSLALHFGLAQYKAAAEIINLCSWITVLKIHFMGAGLCQAYDINQTLKALLPHCPALEQLSIFEVGIDIDHIRTVAVMLPQLVLLEVEFLTLDTLVLGQKEEKESMPVFPALKTLKLPNTYNYSYDSIEKFMGLFPNLKDVQIPAKNVVIPLIDALSKLHHLRSLEIINGLLPTKTAEYLLEMLPTLECLSVGVYELDSKLAHALSKCTRMHALKLRGQYIPGFLSSLLQPSPLMTTLKSLCIWRNSGPFYRKSNFSAEDKHSKEAAMKNFGCAVEIKH
ncbi:hypothetical protein NECID01_1488 [Nematocida sp. AWRm77]|nr:hypothetical protein NECID01_1488 [Nematocida sp. AWRm77]